MGLLGMFDKLDDIVFEPVKAICEWAKEPLNVFENKRQQKNAKLAAEIEAEKREHEYELEMRKKEQDALLEVAQKKWNADIDDYIQTKEIARNKKIIDAIVEYQHCMMKASNEIRENLCHMEISLIKEVHELLLCKTEEYEAFKDKAIKKYDEQYKEVQEKYADNERMRIMREDMIIDQMRSVLGYAEKFISELNEDIDRIKINNTNRIDEATSFANKTIERMGMGQFPQLDTSINLNKIEKKY